MFKKNIIILFIISFHIINLIHSQTYITGDFFKNLSDFKILSTQDVFDYKQVKNGDIIFVKTDFLEHFFSHIHPKIYNRYILITHNSDYSVPNNFAYYLNDSRLIAWFGINQDIKYHPKFHCIPVGIANECWPHGDKKILDKVIGQKPDMLERNSLLCINFTPNSYGNRVKIYELLKEQNFSTLIEPTDFENWLRATSQSVFVASPLGNGLDCHRTWEALYLGAIPIVESSTIDSVFQELPVVIIKDWDKITLGFLLEKYREITNNIHKYKLEKIYTDYWFNLIHNLKKQNK